MSRNVDPYVFQKRMSALFRIGRIKAGGFSGNESYGPIPA